MRVFQVLKNKKILILESQDDARGIEQKGLSNSSMQLPLIMISQCLCKFVLKVTIVHYLYKFNERS